MPIGQFVIFPADPVYCRATPHDDLPCLRKPVSSTTSTASSSARCSMTYSRAMSRNAPASHRSRPYSACCRHGLGSPAASGASIRLASLIPKKTVEEQSRVDCGAVLRKQLSHLMLHLSQRRCP